MSTSIDQRVVQMRFDNTDFEKNANATIGVLEKLKQKLTFKDSSKALDELQTKASSLNFNTLEQSANSVGSVLETKLIAKLTVVHNLVNRITDAGVNMVKSLTVDPAVSGFTKYEQKLNSVQTIMNATGKSADQVNTYLDKLMWYTDETSYSFNDMIATVGKFTSAGQDIDKSVTSIIGIANAAGLAGAGIQNASHAMDGFSKAMGKGYMENQTWEWIRTAKMDTETLKQTFIDTAVEMGTLKKTATGYVTALKGTTVAVGDFQTALKEGWLSTDVLHKALGKFGQYAEGVYELYDAGMSTTEAMEALSGQFDALGEKGFRASQEAKTFSDAINAVKDAVSSGWMKTYEIIFGDYEKSKQLWTDFNSELYDIFAAGAEARNELLERWARAGGRDVLLKGIADGWTKIKNLMGIVKKAFEEVFPPVTLTNLLNLTNGFQRFIKSLEMSEDAAYSLKVILKTLLLPLKLLSQGLKVGVSAFKLFIIVVQKLANTMLTMMANSEYALKVFQKLFGEAQGTRIFNALSTIFTNAGNAISEFAEKLKNLKETLSKNEGFLSFIDGAKNAIHDFIKNGLELLATGLESIASGDWEPFFKMVTDGFKSLPGFAGKAASAVQSFISMLAQLSGIKLPEFSFTKLLESIKEVIDKLNPFKEGIEDTSEKGETLKETVANITKAIIEFVSKINPAKILVFGFGVALIGLIVSISKLVTAAADVTSSFNGIGKSFKGVLDAIKTRIDPTIKKTKTFGDTCLKIAASVIILVAAMTALSKIPAEDLSRVTWTIVGLTAAFTGALMLITLFNGIGAKLGATENSVNSLSRILLAFSIAIAAFSLSIKLLDSVEISPWSIVALIGMLVALTGSVSYLAKQEGSFEKGAWTIVSLAAALLIITKAINSLDQEKAIPGVIAMIVLMGMMTLMLKAVSGAGEHAGKAAGGAIKIAIALGLMAVVIKMVGEMFIKYPEQMVMGAVVAGIELVALLIAMCVAVKKGEAFDAAAKGFKKMATAIALMTIPIFILGSMDEGILLKGMKYGGIILGVLSLISTIVNIFSEADEKHGTNFGKGLIAMAAAITILVIPISILGSLETESLRQGVIAVSALIVVMGLMSLLAKKSEGAKTALVPMIAAIGVFTTAIALLTLLPWEEVLRSTAILSLAVLALGAAMSMMSNMSPKAGTGVLISVISFILLIGATFDLINNLGDLDAILVKVASLSAILISIATAAWIVSKASSGEWKNMPTLLLSMGLFVAMAGAVVLALGKIGGNDIDRVLLNAIALSGVLLAVAGAAKIASGIEGMKFDSWKQAGQNIAMMVAFIGTAALAVGLLGKFGGNNMEQVLSNAVALSLVLLATAGAAAVLTDSSSNKWDKELEKKAEAMVAFIAVAAIAVGLLGNFGGTDPAAVIANAVALGIVVDLMAVAVKIMAKGKFEDGYEKAISMTIMILAAAGALLMLRDVPTEGLLDKTLAIIGILAALTAVTVILGKIPLDPKVVLDGLVSIGEVFLAIAVVFGVVGGLANWLDKNNAIEAALDRAASIFEKIGSVIGAFVGGIVAGYNDASTRNAEEISERMATFINNFSGAIENINKYDENLLAKYDNFASAVDTMRDISNKIGAVTGDNLVAFGTKLNDFAPQFATFCDSIKGYGTDDVTAAINAADTMASIAERLTPGLFENTPSLTGFGEQLDAIAPYISNFVSTISEAKFNKSKVETAVNAASAIAGFATELADNTVYASMSMYGTTNGPLAAFATELSAFADPFKTYSETISTIDDWSKVEASSTAAKTIADFADKLPGKEGIKQTILGESKSLTTFAEELDSFAPSFVTYANKMGEVTDWSVVTKSSDAAKTIANFANKLPSMGGWFQDWFGSKSLATFGIELNMFGSRFKLYSDSVENLNIEAIKNSADAAASVVAVYAGMPTTGGWLEWFLGKEKMDLSTFSQGMSDLGDALFNYSEKAKELSLPKMIAATTAAGLVADLVSELADFKKNNLENFTKAMKDFGGEGVELFLKQFTDAGTKFVEAGQTVIGKLVTGLESRKSNITTAGADAVIACLNGVLAETRKGNAVNAGKALGEAIASGVRDEEKFMSVGAALIDYISKGIENKKQNAIDQLTVLMTGLLGAANSVNRNNDAYSITYQEFAHKMIEGLIKGWNDKKKVMDDNLSKLIKSISEKFKKSDKEFQNIGVNIIKGIAKGMTKEQATLNKTSGNVATGIIAAMKAALGIHSPSREGMEVGSNVDKGVGKGIRDSHASEKAAKDKSHSIINVFATNLDNTDGPVGFLHSIASAIRQDTSIEDATMDKAHRIASYFNKALNTQSIDASSLISSAEFAFIKPNTNSGNFISGAMPQYSTSKGLMSFFETFMRFPNGKFTGEIHDRYTEIEDFVKGSIKTVDDFSKSLSDLYAIDSFHLESQEEASRKITFLTEMLKNQNEVVHTAELEYLNAVKEYGEESAEASEALTNWTREKMQSVQYENDLLDTRTAVEAPKRMRELTDAIRVENDYIEKEQKRLDRATEKIKDAQDLVEYRNKNMGNVQWTKEAVALYNKTMEEAVEAQKVVEECNANISASQAKVSEYEKELIANQEKYSNTFQKQAVIGVKYFLNLVGDSVADLRTVENEEAKGLLEFIDALQNDVADGILSNPAVLDAITEKFGDVLDLFSDMTADIDRKFETQSKEYQLWELTVGADATDEEKNAKKLEIMEKEIMAAANKVKVAAKKEQEAVKMYGAGSVEAQEAHNELLDAQIEQAKLIDDYYETQFNMEQDAQKAIKAAEETNKKGKTALEKAQEEFEEWRKDGSLEKWYEYGATDEELMEALLKKYKDDEDKTTKVEEEAEKSYQRSGKAITDMMNASFAAADYDVDAMYASGQEALIQAWAKEWTENADSAYEAGRTAGESYASGYGDGISGVTGITSSLSETPKKTVKYGDTSVGKVNLLVRDKKTGVESWTKVNQAEYQAIMQAGDLFEVVKMVLASGEEILADGQTDLWRANLDKINEQYDMVMGLEYYNEKGTWEKINDPVYMGYVRAYEELTDNDEYRRIQADYLAALKENPLTPKPEELRTIYDEYFARTGYSNMTKDRNQTNTTVVLLNPVTGLWEDVSMTKALDLINQGWEYLEYEMDELDFGGNPLNTKLVSKTFNPNRSDYNVDHSSTNAWMEEMGIDPYASMSSIQEAQAEKLQSITTDSVTNAVSTGLTDGYLQGLSTGIGNINAMDPSSTAQQVLNQYDPSSVVDEVVQQYIPDPNSWAAQLDNFTNSAQNGVSSFFQGLTNAFDNGSNYLLNTDFGDMNIGGIADALGFGSGGESRTQNSAAMLDSVETSGEMAADVFSAGLQNEGKTTLPESMNTFADVISAQHDLFTRVGDAIALNIVDGILNGLNERAPSIADTVSSITPVIDMDSAKSQFKAIDLAKSSWEKAASVAIAIEDRRKTTEQSPQTAEATGPSTVINYTQNNTSPKALSRYDIYRDTQNQLARLKGAISNK